MQYLLLLILFIGWNLIILFLYARIFGLPSRKKYYLNKFKADSVVFTIIVLSSLIASVISYPPIMKSFFNNNSIKIDNLDTKFKLMDKLVMNEDPIFQNALQNIKDNMIQKNEEINELRKKINIIKEEINEVEVEGDSTHADKVFDTIFNNLISFILGIIASIFASLVYANMTKELEKRK